VKNEVIRDKSPSGEAERRIFISRILGSKTTV
jgi:hypothetical protein